MTNQETAVNEPEVKETSGPGTMPRQQRPLIPCEVAVLYIDKVNALYVSIDIPQNLPNGLIQIQCGDELIVINPQQVRMFKVKPIKQEEKRIIS